MVMKAVIKRVYQNSILTEHVIKVVNIMVVIIFWAHNHVPKPLDFRSIF